MAGCNNLPNQLASTNANCGSVACNVNGACQSCTDNTKTGPLCGIGSPAAVPMQDTFSVDFCDSANQKLLVKETAWSAVTGAKFDKWTENL